jgi:signal transduction histidine kinase
MTTLLRWRLLVAAVLLGAACDSAPLLAQDQKHVLILWGGRPDLPVNIVVNQTIRATLYQEFGSGVDLRFEYVEDIDQRQEQLALRDFLRQKYASYRVDLIIAIAGSAIDFARTQAGELFPRVPVLCWGQANAVGDWSAGPPSTGVVVELDPAANVRFILQAQPDTNHLVVIAGASAYDDRMLLRTVLRDLQAYDKRLRQTFLVGRSLEEVRQAVAQLPEHTAILYVSMHGDGAGNRLVNVDAMSSIAASANAPVYVMVASHLGAGAVGGVVGSQEAMTEAAAKVAVRILRGTPIEQLPTLHLPLVPMVDWRQLQRFGIDESNLPPGTVVLYREASLWQTYRWRILGVAALCVGQALLILALLVQRARRHRAERAEKEQHRQLAYLSRLAMLGELTGTLAHEINQPLTAMLSNAQAARYLLEADTPDVGELRETIDDIVSDNHRAREVMGRLRGMLKRAEVQLQPVDLNEVVREVVELAHSDLVAHGVNVVLELEEGLPAVAADRVQLQQVLLNLVLNGCDAMEDVASGPKDLTVTSARRGEDNVVIGVRDRGTGIAQGDFERIFEPFFTSKREGLGLGLAICRTIANAHGGRLWATNNDLDRGATLHFMLPCDIPGPGVVT